MSAAPANRMMEVQLRNPVPESAHKLNYRIVVSYPHDRRAFTQGLIWHGGKLFESTGQHGESSLREVELKSGRVVRKVDIPRQHFGEGLAMANSRLYQLTWQSGQAFVYDLSFKQVGTFRYEGEGWGLAFDGKHLIMSDGSDILTFRNPGTFQPVRNISVRLNGAPVRSLNELEYIGGLIWANVWQTDYIVCIDPQTGKVRSYLDLRGLLPSHLRTGQENVLNGIAWDKSSKRIYLTGKLWPRVFEIALTKKTDGRPKLAVQLAP